MRPTDVTTKRIIDPVIRCMRKDPDWIYWTWQSERDIALSGYLMSIKPDFYIVDQIFQQLTSVDLVGIKALGVWAANGPKTFTPTVEQALALENVEVRLSMVDYSMPFPALMVQLPKMPAGKGYDPFTSVLVYMDSTGGPINPQTGKVYPMLSCSLFSPGNVHDIVTVVASHFNTIEESILHYDEECREVQHVAPKALRVALNSCLALVNYGTFLEYFYPHERASDERLGAEKGTERGERARERLLRSEMRVSFSQNIQLHNTEGCKLSEGLNTGREMPCHWRKGHWAMQPYGPHNTLRKRILRKPVLVRPDLFMGDVSETNVEYRG